MSRAFSDAFTAQLVIVNRTEFEPQFFTAKFCQPINSVAEFVRLEKQVRKFAFDAVNKIRNTLFRKHYKNAEGEERQGATVASLIMSTQMCNIMLRKWHKWAAMYYALHVYLLAPQNALLFSCKWACVPLEMLQHWALETARTFSNLLENNTILLDDLVAPFSCAVKLSLKRPLVPPEEPIASWNCDPQILIFGHFCTLAKTMPDTSLRAVLTCDTFIKLKDLHNFALDHKSHVPIKSNATYERAHQLCNSKCLPVYRTAMLAFVHHVQHEIIRMHHYMPLTTDVEDIWLYWAVQLLQSIDVTLHVFGALEWGSVPENKAQLDNTDLERMQKFVDTLARMRAEAMPIKRARLQDFQDAIEHASNVEIILN